MSHLTRIYYDLIKVRYEKGKEYFKYKILSLAIISFILTVLFEIAFWYLNSS